MRRLLASGIRTQVVASLGYEDDSAAQVMRAPEFSSSLEKSLKATSEAFQDVVVTSLEVEITASTGMTSTSMSTTVPGESNSSHTNEHIEIKGGVVGP